MNGWLSVELSTRLLNTDWIVTANCLELTDCQRFLFLCLPHIADSNGCFESRPKNICELTRCNLADLELLFKIMIAEGLLESYQINSQPYWYLTKFLSSQRLRTRAKVPCPPWVVWQPDGSSAQSRGCYIDTRQQQSTLEPIDTKPPLEEKRIDIDKNRIGGFLSNKENTIYTEIDLQKLFDEIATRVDSMNLDHGTAKMMITTELRYRARGMGLLEMLEGCKIEKLDKWRLT